MKRKYATIRAYQEYIDIIREDLGITEEDGILLDITFGVYRHANGDAILYGRNGWNVRWGEVRIDKRLNHEDVLDTIMHELRHIWQYKTGKLEDHTAQTAIWDGKTYKSYDKVKANDKDYDKYLNSLWEVDAREYSAQIQRLFPNFRIQRRQLIGEAQGIKVYKIRKAM